MRYDNNFRMQVVDGFLSSGLSQVDFCNQNPGLVSPRTLRAWLRLAEARDPSGKVLRILDQALSTMEQLRASLLPMSECEDPALAEPIQQRPTTTDPPRASTRPAIYVRPARAPRQEPTRRKFDWTG